MYIRAFQQASDLDDSVEDKLLIGDRPKPSNDPENQQPLRERLIKKKDEEVEDALEKYPRVGERGTSVDIVFYATSIREDQSVPMSSVSIYYTCRAKDAYTVGSSLVAGVLVGGSQEYGYDQFLVPW